MTARAFIGYDDLLSMLIMLIDFIMYMRVQSALPESRAYKYVPYPPGRTHSIYLIYTMCTLGNRVKLTFFILSYLYLRNYKISLFCQNIF